MNRYAATFGMPGSMRHWGLLLFLFVVLSVPWLAERVANNQYGAFVLPALLFTQVYLSLRWWRLSVYLLTVYVMFEGFLVNYFSERPELNLLKDLQMGVIFFFLVVATVFRGYLPIPKAIWIPSYLCFSAVYLAEVFNPNLPTILVGLVGVRVTLLFFLCFAIGYWFFWNGEAVKKFLRFQLWLSFPICLFGIYQYYKGPSVLLAMSPGFKRAIFYVTPTGASKESFFRTISTFASTSGFSQYLWATLPLTLVFLMIAKTQRHRLLAVAGLVLQAAAALTTGSRGPVVLVFPTLLLGYFLMRRIWLGFFSTLVISLLFLVAIQFFGPAVEGRFATIFDLEQTRQRNTPLAWNQFVNAMQSPPGGLGAGRLSTAAYRLRPDMPMIVFTENQVAKIRYEAGLPGLIFFVLAVVLILLDTMRVARSFRDAQLRTIGCMAAGFCITVVLIMPVGLPLDVPPTNFFFWFLLGMIYAIARIEYAEALATRPVASPFGPRIANPAPVTAH